MNKLFFALAIFSLARCLLFGQGASTNPALGQLPANVQKTIREQLGGAKLAGIERNSEDGEITFTVSATKGDTEREFTVGEDGTLLSLEIALEDAPPVVQKAIKAQVGQGGLDSVSKQFDDNEINYEVQMTRKDGAERSFTVALDGKLISLQLSLEETPPAIRKTIQANLGSGKLGDIYRVLEEGEVSYWIEVTRDGKTSDFSVGPDGKLQRTRVALEDVPPPAQKTIREKIGEGKILRIYKSFEARQGVLPFEIEARKDGKPFDFSVGPRGRFLGMDD